jgi:hypothetical protein
MARARQSALQRAYNRLRSVKAQYCRGKVPKVAVTNSAASYKKQAVASGQTLAEAKKKANKVLRAGCSMSSYIAKKGTKRRKPGRPKKKR